MADYRKPIKALGPHPLMFRLVLPSGAGISGVTCHLRDDSGEQVRDDAVTDPHGYARWYGLAVGEYVVVPDTRQYASAPVRVKVPTP